jgi:hypothetical protein
MTNNTATATVTGTFTFNGTQFTQAQAVAHGEAVFDTLCLQAESMLDGYNELGSIFLGIRSLHKSDKIFHTEIMKTGLGNVNRYDRNDMMVIASNFPAILRLRKRDDWKVDLKNSAIVKRFRNENKKAKNEGKAASAGNVSKGKGKAKSAADGPSVTENHPFAEAMTEAELAAYVLDMIAVHGLDKDTFAKELRSQNKDKA